VATIPPSPKITGDAETRREAVNASICGAPTVGAACGGRVYLDNAVNGYVDFDAAISADGTDTGSAVKAADLFNGFPDNRYYKDEASAYLNSNSLTLPAQHHPPGHPVAASRTQAAVHPSQGCTATA